MKIPKPQEKNNHKITKTKKWNISKSSKSGGWNNQLCAVLPILTFPLLPSVTCKTVQSSILAPKRAVTAQNSNVLTQNLNFKLPFCITNLKYYIYEASAEYGHRGGFHRRENVEKTVQNSAKQHFYLLLSQSQLQRVGGGMWGWVWRKEKFFMCPNDSRVHKNRAKLIISPTCFATFWDIALFRLGDFVIVFFWGFGIFIGILPLRISK